MQASLISLKPYIPERDFDTILGNNLFLKFSVFRKHFDILNLEFSVYPGRRFIWKILFYIFYFFYMLFANFKYQIVII